MASTAAMQMVQTGSGPPDLGSGGKCTVLTSFWRCRHYESMFPKGLLWNQRSLQESNSFGCQFDLIQCHEKSIATSSSRPRFRSSGLFIKGHCTSLTIEVAGSVFCAVLVRYSKADAHKAVGDPINPRHILRCLLLKAVRVLSYSILVRIRFTYATRKWRRNTSSTP